MSLTPTTPDFKSIAKSWWDRPEGKFGKWFLILGGVAAAGAFVFFWGLILPFLIGVVGNTIQLAALCGVLLFLWFLATNKKIHVLVKNIFQLSMRWIASAFVNVDPIGILQNHLDDMKKKKDEMEDAISKVAGSKKGLETNIAKKKSAIEKDKNLVAEVERLLSVTPENQQTHYKRVQWTLDRQRYLQDAGMKMETYKKQSGLLDQTNKMYDMLYRWGMLADHNIATMENTVEEKKEERKSLMAGYEGLNAVKRIIKGEPEELELFNLAMENLADDAANKLGAMEDFARYSEKFLDDMDIENGAAAAGAEKMFAEFEQKMLESGGSNSTVIQTTQNSEGVYVPQDYTRYLQ